MKSILSPKQRLLSAILCLSFIITSIPVLAANMSVQLQVSDPSPILPVGTEITVRVLGTNTAAESLMIVDPGSRQQFLFGPEHTVKFTQPGIYILAGYGANGTDETAPGFQRCMSAFHMVTVEGNADQGMEGALSIEVYHNRQWQPLQNARIRKPELLLRFTYNGQPLPEDAMLHSAVSWGVNTVSLLEGTVATDTQWTYDAADTALSLVESYTYQQYDMTVNADITLPDGQSVFVCADFSMGHYSPEMLYVNEFFDENWNYGKSEMGQRLVKWLDMSPRTENRNNSGYLMLEEEIEFREEGLRKAAENFVHWTSDVLSAISSLGVDILVKEWSDHEAQKKFGPEGTKALKYYNMLGSVYNSYAQTLANELQSVARGAYLEEEISKNLNFIPRVNDIPDIADAALDARDLRNTEPDENLIYLFSPLNADSSYLMVGNVSRLKGSVNNLTLTGVSQKANADGTVKNIYSWKLSDGKSKTGDINKFVDYLEHGDDIIMDISSVTAPAASAEKFSDMFQNDLAAAYMGKTYSPKQIEPDIEQFIVKTKTDSFGKRKLIIGDKEYDFNYETLEQLGITDALNSSDRECLQNFSTKSNWLNDPLEFGQKVADLAGIGMDVYELLKNRKQQSALQEAYFAVYKEVSAEYIHALYSWYKQLEGSKSEDAEAIRAAIMALMNDIYASCDKSLSKAAQLEITHIQTSTELATLLLDVCSFVCDIPGVKEGLLHFGKHIVSLLNKPINMTIDAYKAAKVAKAAKATKATAATVATTAQSATKLVSNLNLIMLGIQVASLVMDILLSAHFGYIDSIYTVYNTKKALNESLEKMLHEYGTNPTHQKAIDIIESLYLMKELKLKGENMITSAYLSGMYKDFDLESIEEQLVLMNEIINMDSSKQLSGYKHTKDNPVSFVTVMTRHYFNNTTKVYTRDYFKRTNAPLSYKGVELKPIPDNIQDALKIDSRSIKYSLASDYAVIMTYPYYHQYSLSNDNAVSTYYSEKYHYLYQKNGMDILLSKKNLETYKAAEENVNRILRENSDETGDDLAFWQIQAKKEWQWEQRIIWTYVTRKYIESLPMFDRTQN